MSTSSSTSAWEIELLFGSAQQPLSYLQAVWLDTKLTVNQVPSATVVLSAPGGISADLKALSDDAERCEPGTKVVINIKSSTSRDVLFSGIVQQQSYSTQVGRSELTLKLRHPLQKLVATHRSQLFEQMSDKQVLQQLLQDHEISEGKSLSGLAVEHPQMVQFDCSDWQFIKARLNANGVWLLPEVDGGVSVKLPAVSNAKAQHTLNQSQTTAQTGVTEPLIIEAYWQFNGMEQPGKLAVTSWDIKQQAMSQNTRATSSALGVDGLDPGRFVMSDQQQWLLTSSLSLLQNESKALADSRYLALQAKGIQACFTLAGDAAYHLGETLALSGFGTHFNGKGVISSVQHKISRGTWRTVVKLGQDGLNDIDEPLLPSITGLQVGIVEDYEEDPDSLNRLRVKVPAVGDKSLWARFAMPYASKDSGLCLYPEPGDEVVLGFFAEDPRYPVILGSMHNPKNTAPFAPSQTNNKKGLVFVKDDNTRQLLFDTDEGSLLLQYDKDHLSLKKGIELRADQDIEVSGSNVKVSAAKNMMLKSDNKLEVGAKTLSATGNDSVKVKGNAIELG
jgi:Rhs element Vgr protein